VKPISGDLGAGDPPAQRLVEHRIGVLDRDPRVLGDLGNRGLDGGVLADGDRHVAAAADRRADRAAAVKRRIHPYQRTTVREQPTDLRAASATSRFAPRGDPQEPFRSRCATITGAAAGVDPVASNAFSPRTFE